jgi:hypothetical protein
MTTFTVIHVQDTGNVLAAVSLAAPPEPAPPVGDLVGAGLPLRLLGLPAPDAITVPADRLATVTVDNDAAAENPRASGVVELVQNGEKRHKLELLKDSTTSVDTDLDSTGAKVRYTGTAAGAELAVLVVMEQSGPQKLLSGVIPATAQQVTLPGTFTSGEQWRTLTFVHGFTPSAEVVTVT